MRKILSILAITLAFPAFAAEPKVYEITIKDHLFTPAEIKIPANEAVILHVKNLDSTPEEFESHKLKVEKIIAGNSEAKIRLRPMEAGTYKFEGEFNPTTAQGVVIAE
jgi:heme/copper-type cytochrome/quinol oxidase subunit 2